MASLILKIKTDRDYMALVAYRVALEAIVEEADATPWASNEAAYIARRVLQAFPGNDPC